MLCGYTLYLFFCPSRIGVIPCHPVCPLWYQSRLILAQHSTPIGWYVRDPSIFCGFATAMLYLLIWILPYLFCRCWWGKCGLVHSKLIVSSRCLRGTSRGSSYRVSDCRECWAGIGTEKRHPFLSENAWFLQWSFLLMEWLILCD